MKRIRLLFLALLVMMMASSTSAMANIAEGESGTCRWVIDDEGTLTISPLEGTSGTLGDWGFVSPWTEGTAYESITSAKFEGTINLITAKGMFSNCTNLKSVDFTGANTDNVTNMSYMFFECSNLKNVNFADINTSNVTNMSNLFNSCINLEAIDISNFNTENVTDMSYMFGGCTKVMSLDISNLNMQSVTQNTKIFGDCTSLRFIYSTNETPGTLLPGTFSSLPEEGVYTLSVPENSVSAYRTAEEWKNIYALGYRAENIYGTSKWAINDEGELTISPLNDFIGTMKNWGNDAGSTPPWYGQRESIKSVKVTGSLALTTGQNMFKDCSNLIQIDLTHASTVGVDNMTRMFYGCTNLKFLDLSNFNTQGISDGDCDELFAGCSNIANIYSLSKEPTALNAKTFNSLSAKETCKLIVPTASISKYQTADGWKEFSTIEGGIGGGISGTCFWKIDSNGVLTISPLAGESGTLGDWTNKWDAPWLELTKTINDSIKCAKFEGTIYLATAKNMFSNCTNLKSVDFTGANTNNVTNMSYMFFNCQNLTNINFADINTSNVTDMSNLLNSCISLETIDISNLNTENVTNMSNMFGGCIKLKSLDLSNLNMQSVTNHSHMFGGCTSLRSIYSTKETPGTLQPGTFSDLADIGDCKLYVTAEYAPAYRAAEGWNELPVIGTFGQGVCGTCRWTLDDTGLLTVSPLEGTVGTLADWGANDDSTPSWYMFHDFISSVKFENTINLVTGRNMFKECSSLNSIDFTGLNTSEVSDMSGMFMGCLSLTTIDFHGLNLSFVTDLSLMFWQCVNLKTLDMSNINTELVTDMRQMFYSCRKLTTLDLTNFNMKNVEEGDHMADMFSGCEALTSIYSVSEAPSTLQANIFSSLPTVETCKLYVPQSSVSDYSNADGWKELTIAAYTAQGDCGTCHWAIDDDGVLTISPKEGESGTLADWGATSPWHQIRATIKSVKFEGTISLATGKNMFSGCSNLTSIDFTGLNTSAVTDMSGMFEGCSNIVKLILSNINSANVTDLSSLFKDCTNLEYLDVSNLNTSAATNMRCMFYNCSKLKTLNLTNLNMQNVVKSDCFAYMFTGCSTLKYIYSTTGNPSTIKSRTFNTLPTKATCKLYEPGSHFNYYNADGWKELNVTDYTDQGVCGTCLWIIESVDFNNHFYIRPMTGEVGTLEDWGELPPWAHSVYDAVDVTIEGEINILTGRNMFYYFRAIPSLDLSALNTSAVTDMYGMFQWCTSLTAFDLSSLNTKNVTNMDYMFENDYSLKSLDLTNLSMESVTTDIKFLSNCDKLNDIYVKNTTPAVLKEDAFNALPKKSTCKLHVPTGSRALYTAAPGWKELLIVTKLQLTDTNPTVIADSYAPGQVSYTRNVAEGIATFCLPFDIDLSAVEGDAIESVYTIYPTAFLKESNKLRLLITEADGNIPAGTPFIAKCQSGEVLFTNTADITYTADTTNPDPTPLTVFEDNGINSVLHHCTSLNVRAGGTYKRWDNPGEGYYVFNTKGNFGPVPTGAYISPFRMYISKTGASASSNAFEIELLFDDENDLTDLKDALISAIKQSAPAYNIMGQKVDANAKGIVIINGNKYYNK